MANRKYILVMILISLGSIGAMLLATEFIILPKVTHMPRELLLFPFTGRPGDTINGQIFNDMGFTGDVVTHTKPPDTIRILLLGGSVMFNRHMSERLAAELKKNTTRHIELLNAGLRAHSSRTDLYKMQYLAKYDFDFVLYYNGINDLWMNAKYPMGFQKDYSHHSAYYRRYPIFDHSALAQVAYRYYYKAYNDFHHDLFDDWNFNYENYASIATFHDNLSQIVQIARSQGSKPVLMTFAFAIPENYTREAFNENRVGYINPTGYNQTPIEMWGYPDYVGEALKRINQEVRQIATIDHVPLIDIDSAMSSHITLFGDVCHFNDDGVDVFVRHVTDTFIKEGWLQ